MSTPAARAVAATPGPDTRRSALLGTALLLAALNLRGAIAVVPPLLDRIQGQLHLSAAAAGALTTLPLICMALFAPVAGRMVTRIGPTTTMAVALVTIAAGSAARMAGAIAAPLYAGTFLAGVGIAVGQTVIPGVVKQHYPRAGGLMTGLYSTAMAVGATVAAALAVPTARLLGSWQASLALWGAPAVMGTVLWVAAAPRDRPAPTMLPTLRAGLPWRSRTAWLVSGFLGVQSFVFYGVLSWLAPMLQFHGWSAARAGYALSAFNLVGIPVSLALPAFAHHLHDRRPAFAAAVGCLLISLPPLALAPTSLSWLWVILAGVGQGGAFALGLTLLIDHAKDPAESARLSALAFLVGYALTAVSPVLMGYLRDVTGGFRASFLLLSAATVVELALTFRFTPARRAEALTR